MRRLLTPVIAALLLTGAAAPVAEAVDLDAPYTQASAMVGPNGAAIDKKMITNAWRVATGQYCIQIDPLVNVTEATVLVDPGWAGSAASRKGSSMCGGGNTVGVYVWDLNGNYVDNGYTIAVL